MDHVSEQAGIEGPPLEGPGAAIGHYEIIRALGKGGMGEVYLARDTQLGRRVALKILSKVSEESLARFFKEAQATAQLDHESIVRLHHYGKHGDRPYMVLEYVPGKTLGQWLAEQRAGGRKVSPAHAAELMLPVARALACAHRAGIVHRDLKPGNIMLAESGVVKVLDLGIAKLLEEEDGEDEGVAPMIAMLDRLDALLDGEPGTDGKLTDPRRWLGTAPYTSPEQMNGGPVDARTDLWAAGVVLHEMVTGELPVPAGLEQPIPSVRERHPDLGKLGAVIDRCLVERRADRLGSAEELAQELSAVVRAGSPDEGNPYPGLSAFQERDAGRFFGRERAVAQVVARLAEEPLLAVVGSSGAGKSSLVRAGVIPALKRGGDAWDALVLRPLGRPLAALADLLLSLRPGAGVVSREDRDALAKRLLWEPGQAGVALRARAARRGERLLLFVDQLEEVVTRAVEDERGPFLACLMSAADDPSSSVRVIVSVRQDFLDRVAALRPEIVDLLGRGTVLVSPLGPAELRDALVKPAEMRGHCFESEALVDQILRDLGRVAGALPLLQFTASALWDERDRERQMLTAERYLALGGVGGALAKRADSALAGLRDAEREQARRLLLGLVTPDRTGISVTLRELHELAGARAAQTERVLGRLVDARLLTVVRGQSDEDRVELSHESLIKSWPALVHWLDGVEEDAHFRARLRSAAREWESRGEAEGLLWHGEEAEEARQWGKRKEAGTALLEREERYLRAAIALEDRGRRRRRTMLGALVAGLVLVALVVSLLAVRSSREAARAEAARAEAERSAANARNATRMAVARGHQDDPTTVLALLREVELDMIPPGWSELAKWALGAGVSRAVLLHDDRLDCAAWSPDGRRIATAGKDGNVRVWDAGGTEPPLVLRGHDLGVRSVAWSPDGRHLASSSVDKTIRVWNADGSGQPLVLRGHVYGVPKVAWSLDGRHLASASADATVRVWNADGSGEPLVLRGHDKLVSAVAWSPDGRHLASASADSTVRVWNADGSGQPLVLRGHSGTVWGVAVSPDGLRVASAADDKTVRVWSADGSGQPLVLHGHGADVYAVAWSPDGQRIASGSDDQTVRLWNADGSGHPRVLRRHEAAVWAVAWSPDGRSLLSASSDRTVRVWSVDAPEEPLLLQGHEAAAWSASWSPDGRHIASAADDHTVRVWNADGSGEPLVLHGHDNDVKIAAFSPDGRRIASASDDHTVRVWNADGSGAPLVVRGHANKVRLVAWSPDGRRLASSSWDNTVRIWDVDGASQPLVLRGPGGVFWNVAWSPDGRRIVSMPSNDIWVWNADGAGEPLVLRGHGDIVFGATFSPDGRRIASASWDKTVRVWNADGSDEPLVLRGHETRVATAEWSPDGRRIVSASQDGTVRVWDAGGAGEPLVLRASDAALNAASWSPDGRRIAAASADTRVIVWSDLTPLSGPGDPKLWTATTYCLPVDVRRKLLGFSEAQARADLERCQRRVGEARPSPMP